jgi:hypothetical protein
MLHWKKKVTVQVKRENKRSRSIVVIFELVILYGTVKFIIFSDFNNKHHL